jgi:predicted TIM-barrel fold metal-dependent hydrolase
MTWVDCTAFCGPYPRRPIGLEPAALWARLAPFGLGRTYASRLEALWFENAHDANRLAERLSDRPSEVILTPVVDPSLATWREELDRLAALGQLKVVRLHPNYHGYSLADVDPFLAELAKRRAVAQVVVRVDDPRRQHRLARVPDVPPGSVRAAAAKHPTLKVLLSGALTPALTALAKDLPAAGNLWADTSQADGVDAVASLMRTAWRDRLVFGTHAPLLIPEAAFARVVLDLDDATADPVLGGNAAALFGPALHSSRTGID